MIWNLRFRKELESLLDFRDQGIHVHALDEKNVPNLRADEQYLLDLFFLLARSRPPAFSSWLAPVPLSEITSCYDRFGLRKFIGLWGFVSWMQMLDQAVIEHFAPKEKKDSDKKKESL